MKVDFRARYGAGPLHLVGMLACLALALYAVTRVLADTVPLLAVLVWFVGAAIVHDLVLFPVYVLAGRALRTNWVRVPAALSALLLLIWFPLVLGGMGAAFEGATGLSTGVYLGRWLAVTAVLFAISGAGYGVWRLRRHQRPGPPTSSVVESGATSTRHSADAGAPSACTTAARTTAASATASSACGGSERASSQAPTRVSSAESDSPPCGAASGSVNQADSPAGSAAPTSSSERPAQSP